MGRTGKLERKPLLAVVVTVVFFAWLYLPILAVALFPDFVWHAMPR
jgi:spermidine/putrescine transport system permease protein/putrescine transport system permease protein